MGNFEDVIVTVRLSGKTVRAGHLAPALQDSGNHRFARQDGASFLVSTISRSNFQMTSAGIPFCPPERAPFTVTHTELFSVRTMKPRVQLFAYNAYLESSFARED